MVRWTDIDPGADGGVAVRVEARAGSPEDRKAYSFAVFMVEEQSYVCGDGAQDPGEDCGDGNQLDGDCCASDCSYESSGSPCDDSVACTSPDTCDGAGTCVGTPDNGLCDDTDVCTDDTCNPAAGCEYAYNTGPCDDGVACTELDVCDGAGSCGGAPNDGLCDDTDVCTDDVCNPLAGCQNPYNTAPCDDGVACTTSDVCDGAGTCGGTPDDGLCDDGTFCNGPETCDSQLGCQAGTPPTCDDGVDCTTDLCLTAIDACLNSPNHASCGNGDVCDGSEVCDPELGCQPGTPLDCDDENECTNDDCRPTLGCRNLPNTDPCDDLNICTENDVCSGGACSGTEIPGCSAPVPSLGPWAQVFTGLFVLAAGVGLLSERRRRSR